MVLNYIWIAFFLIAFIFGVIALITGDAAVLQKMLDATFSASKGAFETSLGLTGVLALWLGIMKIGERAGVVNVLARMLNPVFTKLFPDIPKNHPVMGSIFMNIASNMLGLDNAATPTGLKAMAQMQELNTQKKDTATNPMIMFLVLNTSGLTLIPVSILVYRSQLGAQQPTDVFIPILLATFFSTLAGIIITSVYQRINLFNRTMLLTLGGMLAIVGGIIWGFGQLNKEQMSVVSTSVANIVLMTVIIAFILAGVRKRINVYDAFIEGAKEGFQTAVRIIPYLVAILVAIGVFRASGAMDMLVDGIKGLVAACGGNTAFVEALPTALMKPLSGSGARGMMVDTVNFPTEIDKLGLKKSFELLKAANDTFEELRMQRQDNQIDDHLPSAREARKHTDEVYEEICHCISAAYLMAENQADKDIVIILVNELNTSGDAIRKSHSESIAMKKAAKKKKEENKETE